MPEFHGNLQQKWKIDYRSVTNDFLFQNLDTVEHHVLPVVRDNYLDLALYLRRLQATDDSFPVTIRNDTYKNMAKEIIDRSDQIVYIRKGRWSKTVLTIQEDIKKIETKLKVQEFLKSDKNYEDFLKEL